MFIAFWCAFSCDRAFTMKKEKAKNTTSESIENYNEASTERLKNLLTKVSYYHMFRNISYIKKIDREILTNDTVVKDTESLLKKGANPNLYGSPVTKTFLQIMLTILAKHELPEEEIKRVNSMTQLLILYGAKAEMNFKFLLQNKKELKCLLKIQSTMIQSQNKKSK